jgi:hypothetical protein
MLRYGNGIVWRLGLSCLLGFALVCAPGCGKSKGKVSGTVKLKDGTPVSPGSTVTFWSGDNRMYPGLVDKDGAYAVPDVPVGEMKVTVTPPNEALAAGQKAKPPGEKSGGDAKPTKTVPIPQKYQSEKTTTLKTTVQKGDNTYDPVIE